MRSKTVVFRDELDINLVRNALVFWYNAGRLLSGQEMGECDKQNINRVYEALERTGGGGNWVIEIPARQEQKGQP